MMPEALEALITELQHLPGVGPRTAERLAFFILRSGNDRAQKLASALELLHEGIRSCSICFHLAEEATCAICNSDRRDQSLLAVVEEPLDVIALEKSGHYRGLYHVLGGALSPIDGIGPAELNISPLIKRVTGGNFSEIIIATNPSTEGEATALYIQKQLPDGVSVTRLARGLPVGSDLEYADQITLGRALEGRQAF